jgi:hypothetical protein
VALEGLGPKRFSTHNLPINLEKELMPCARAKWFSTVEDGCHSVITKKRAKNALAAHNQAATLIYIICAFQVSRKIKISANLCDAAVNRSNQNKPKGHT